MSATKRYIDASLKRAFDIFFSLLGLILLSPLFIILTLLIKLKSPGPVFYSQERIGRYFKPFRLYKFRTMEVGADKKGPAITAGGDPRVTPIGKFLRRTKIDELPQLLNVFLGDMSLVGPRPEVEKYVNLKRKDYEKVLSVRPGLTDFASLSFSDEGKLLEDADDPEAHYINVILPEKINLAKEYVKDHSLFDDFILILRTIFKIIYPQERVMGLIESLGRHRRIVIIAIELLIFASANYLAFFIRFEGSIHAEDFSRFIKFLPLLLGLRLVLLLAFSLDKRLWRYVSGRDILRVLTAVSIGSFIFFIGVRYIAGDISYPRSVYVIDWFLNIFMLTAIRFTRRIHEKASVGEPNKRRVIVIGAGSSAEMLIRDIEQSPYYPYKIAGLIDDDPRKRGLEIRGLPILGPRTDLDKIIKHEEPDEFLIAIPSASPAVLEEIVTQLRTYGLPIKTLPSLWSILQGREALSQIKMVTPEDVLFRAPTEDVKGDFVDFMKGKKVLITGAGGSIGSELSRLVALSGPDSLVLFEQGEENLYKIDHELKSLYEGDGTARDSSFISSIIGDVTDVARVSEVFNDHRPDIVFHAAAYKHVPLMEANPTEAFKTNVIGTRTVAEAAGRAGVERFVFISTDKAVNPPNVMGKTKKIAEGLVRELAGKKELSTSYMCVRFGNVLNSSGSVIPLFTEMIKNGGPVTVTHPDITRYFMTIPEAVRLVVEAAVMGEGGEVFVLEMGRPVKIFDLAKRLIALYGFRPCVDIEIVFTGLRPGEKMHEELYNSHEKIEPTSHPRINMALQVGEGDGILSEILARLGAHDHLEARTVLDMLPGCVEQGEEDVAPVLP